MRHTLVGDGEGGQAHIKEKVFDRITSLVVRGNNDFVAPLLFEVFFLSITIPLFLRMGSTTHDFEE